MKTSTRSQASHLGYGYADTLLGFLETDDQTVVGALTQNAARRPAAALEAKLVQSWNESLDWIRAACRELRENMSELGHPFLCLEFEIPRRGGRIDAVLLVRDLIFVIEFKATRADADARRQAEDYGLELMDFHKGSEGRRILPVVCSAEAQFAEGELEGAFGVGTVSVAPPAELARMVLQLYSRFHEPVEDRSEILHSDWLAAPYAPTPTIIEAARALYAGHTVADLSSSSASREHLERSFDALASAMEGGLERGEHVIAFLTGIPGAGKTLAGMNVVQGSRDEVNAAFLSGNGPLVRVLQDVLARDRARRVGESRKAALHETRLLVQNVHRWLDEYVDNKPEEPPFESVIVFDEAQRAWNREQSQRKFKRDASEPEMILEVMERRETGGVVIALVGGGQEINTGEAGLAEWGRALTERFTNWQVFVSPELLAGDASTAGSCLFPERAATPEDRVTCDPDLHLKVSQRSFRSAALTEWVEAVLECDARKASEGMRRIQSDFPIRLTRDLEAGREWLRAQARGERRMGLLASSGARRLRQHGIPVAERVDEVSWFLNASEDVRSSDFLELALSEFGVQGLELDWTCLAWGGDLTPSPKGWEYRQFRGTKWQNVKKEDKRTYTLNRYRVLLTRAREGMVIWVPPGSERDVTRSPERFDRVADFLLACGVEPL